MLKHLETMSVTRIGLYNISTHWQRSALDQRDVSFQGEERGFVLELHLLNRRRLTVTHTMVSLYALSVGWAMRENLSSRNISTTESVPMTTPLYCSVLCVLVPDSKDSVSCLSILSIEAVGMRTDG